MTVSAGVPAEGCDNPVPGVRTPGALRLTLRHESPFSSPRRVPNVPRGRARAPASFGERNDTAFRLLTRVLAPPSAGGLPRAQAWGVGEGSAGHTGITAPDRRGLRHGSSSPIPGRSTPLLGREADKFRSRSGRAGSVIAHVVMSTASGLSGRSNSEEGGPSDRWPGCESGAGVCRQARSGTQPSTPRRPTPHDLRCPGVGHLTRLCP